MHIMLDIEALGRTPGAAVISLGACAFDPYVNTDNYSTFFEAFDLEDVIRKGGKIEGSTLRWWMRQNHQTMQAQIGGTTGLTKGLRRFVEWYKSYKPERVWARGTVFDIAILEATFRMASVAYPWSYTEVRDTRLFDDLFVDDEELQHQIGALIQSGTKHDPVSDAVKQAKIVRLFLQKIEPARKKTGTPAVICARKE